MFNPIYLRIKNSYYKCKCTFNSWIIFNGKDQFSGHWGDHKFYVVCLGVWATFYVQSALFFFSKWWTWLKANTHLNECGKANKMDSVVAQRFRYFSTVFVHPVISSSSKWIHRFHFVHFKYQFVLNVLFVNDTLLIDISFNQAFCLV